MRSIVSVLLILAFAAVMAFGGAETALAGSTTNSSPERIPVPQLAANTNVGPEVPMAAEPPTPAPQPTPRVTEATPDSAQRRKTVWMVVAVVAVVAASYVLQRLRSRSDPS